MFKILIVDDNERVRVGIRSSIEQRTNWTVYEAENGKVAVEMVTTLRPDFVILDLAMPFMNGLVAAREISKIVPGLPMIMFTLFADGLAEDARKAGVTHIFSKADGFGQNIIDAMRALLPSDRAILGSRSPEP